MSIDNCYKKLKELNAPNFIDLEFPPLERNVFLDNNKQFDIVVHWRRP
jgi:hypothetical protein